MGQEDNRYSILNELSKSNDYEIALMTTFNFEINFFERAVLNRLYACGVKKVSLFVDAKELNKALSDVTNCWMGRKYMVTPVEMQKSFHPKVILLLGEKKAKLFVGSANIKTSGYTTNNEIFNVIEYSPQHPKYLDIINAAIQFFGELNDYTQGLDTALIKEAKKQIYFHKTTPNGQSFFLHNITVSALDQVTGLITEKIHEIRIAVPYYDNELNGLSEIANRFKNVNIRLYIQNFKSTFPAYLNEKKNITNDIAVYSGFKTGRTNCQNNFYHGKVFLFRGVEHDYILYGSSNCTKSALTLSFQSGGNVECNLFEVGSMGDFDYFFENMNLQPGAKPESNIMTFENESTQNFFYRFGKADHDIELYVGYKHRKDNISVFLEDRPLDHKYIGDELIIYVPWEYQEILVNNVFPIHILYDNENENINCWYYNPIDIENYRFIDSSIGDLDFFDMNSSGDKFIEDRMALIRAEKTTLPEILEYKKNQSIFNRIHQEDEEPDIETEEENFIVEDPIDDEYRVEYRKSGQTARLRSLFVSQLFTTDSSVLKSIGHSERAKTSVSNTVSDNHIPSRKATSAEKKFESFIKRRVRSMLDEKYVMS